MQRRYGSALIGSAVLALSIGAWFVAGAGVSARDKKTCLDGCAKDLKACLGQTPATDPEHERLRKNACADRNSRCEKNCK
jgi:hypothetical protein